MLPGATGAPAAELAAFRIPPELMDGGDCAHAPVRLATRYAPPARKTAFHAVIVYSAGLVHHFDRKHRRVVRHRHEFEVQLSLGVRLQSVESLGQRLVRAGLLQYIEIPHQRRSVAEDIENARSYAACALVLLAPVGLGEIQGRLVKTRSHRNGIREVPVALVTKEIAVRRTRHRFPMVGYLAAGKIVVGLPDLAARIGNGVRLGDYPDRVDLMRLGGLNLNGAHDRLLAPGVESYPQNSVRPGLDILEDSDVGDERSARV